MNATENVYTADKEDRNDEDRNDAWHGTSYFRSAPERKKYTKKISDKTLPSA